MPRKLKSELKAIMEDRIVKTCERLYKLARKSGKRTTRSDSTRSEGKAVGYGSRSDETHHTLASGAFTIKATKDVWVMWNPTSDSSGTTRTLEILRGKKIIFSASCDGPKHNDRFTYGDERHVGEENTKAESWKREIGKIPVKYIGK